MSYLANTLDSSFFVQNRGRVNAKYGVYAQINRLRGVKIGR